MLTNPVELPLLTSSKNFEKNIYVTPGDKYNKFREAYIEAEKARELINYRLDKLNYESEMLKNIRRNQMNQRINPNMYSNQFIDPVYFPLEYPIRGEPVSLPKIEMGMPLEKFVAKQKKCKHDGKLTMTDVVALMGLCCNKGNNNPIIFDPRLFQQESKIKTPLKLFQQESKIKTPLKVETVTHPRKVSEIMLKASTPSPINTLKETQVIPKMKIDNLGQFTFDWWRVTRNFVNMYKFFSISKKYGKNTNIRDPIINEMTKAVIGHIDSIASWLLAIEDSFIDELRVYNNLNLNFTESNKKFNFKRCSEIIVALLTKFLTNLYSKSGKLLDLPEKIQEILYKYIKEKAYLPRKYLSTYEINRLDFYFYGGLKNVTDFQAAMILAYLIISRSMVQKIFLLSRQSMPQFKNFANIEPTCFILGSILHYLVKGAFNISPAMVKELLALLNYYRNYHLFKKDIESQGDIFNAESFNYEDTDEISKNLIPESELNEFWKENVNWVNWFKEKIFNWAVNMSKIIIKKYTQLPEVNNERKSAVVRPSDRKTTVIRPEDRKSTLMRIPERKQTIVRPNDRKTSKFFSDLPA
jgi:hypothetical protein